MTWQPGDGPLRKNPPVAAGFSAEDVHEVVDVVIVGAGPGGAACARALGKRGFSVLVVEEGPTQSRFRPNQGNVMRHHMQEGGAMVATGTGPLPIAAGRGIGGGSLVNSAIAWRCPDHVLDEWTELLGTDHWSPAALRPYYDELWELLGIWETRPEISGKNNDLIVRGVKALGLEGGYLSRATPGCVGCGVCYFGCPSGGKASVNTNLLADAAEMGVRVQADVKIHGVQVDGGRATGVRGRFHHPDTRAEGGTLTVDARAVVISAGGIGTPRLLHHAGVASTLGPAVGKGLHVHPGSAVIGRCPEPIDMWRGATQGAYFHPPDLPGVLPHTFSAPPEVLLANFGAVGARTKELLADLVNYAGLVVMVSDTGQGTVGAWSDGRARIDYTFADADVERIKAGMGWAARVLLAGGATELYAPVHGVPRFTTPEALAASLVGKTMHDFLLYASHPMSSCRMGRDPASSVLRPDGRTHAVPGLYLADSSIFPTSLGVNPSITTMAMAQRIGEGIELG